MYESGVDFIAQLDRDRPLRYPLRSGDLLLLLHIPKTAGTTLFDILCRRYKSKEIAKFGDRDVVKQLLATPRKQLEQYRLMRTHYDYSIYKFLPRKPVYITILRDPISRMVSLYKHIIRVESHDLHSEFVENDLTISDLVELPMSEKRFNNRQTNQIAGAVRGDSDALSTQARLEVAKAHLDEFAFFGLTERFVDSIVLLAFTFDWDPIKDFESLNVSPKNAKSEALSEEEREIILHHNQLDVKLYEHAYLLFGERIQKMKCKSKMQFKPRSRAGIRTLARKLIPLNSKRETIYLFIRRLVRGD